MCKSGDSFHPAEREREKFLPCLYLDLAGRALTIFLFKTAKEDELTKDSRWERCLWSLPTLLPSNFFSAIESYCSRLSVSLLTYDSRSALIRLDRRKQSGRTLFVSYFYFNIQGVKKRTLVSLSNARKSGLQF